MGVGVFVAQAQRQYKEPDLYPKKVENNLTKNVLKHFLEALNIRIL